MNCACVRSLFRMYTYRFPSLAQARFAAIQLGARTATFLSAASTNLAGFHRSNGGLTRRKDNAMEGGLGVEDQLTQARVLFALLPLKDTHTTHTHTLTHGYARKPKECVTPTSSKKLLLLAP